MRFAMEEMPHVQTQIQNQTMSQNVTKEPKYVVQINLNKKGQGCQKTRNFVRNSKILISRSTIQPKLSKIKNREEIHQNSLKNGKLFMILLHFGWMVDLAMKFSEFLTKFLVF